MSLSKKQRTLTYNISKLIQFAHDLGIDMVGKEWGRTHDQQYMYYHGKRINTVGELVDTSRKSWTMVGQHLLYLAVDFAFFPRGSNIPIWEGEQLDIIGAYWESLHPKNKWGGNFKNNRDTPHFEQSP